MRYVVIADDGELHVKDGTYRQARAEVGPPGWDRIRLQPPDGDVCDWAGWINGDGHVLGLPRNLVGGLILIGLGAPIQPYPGPVVITGWDPHGQPNEVAGLHDLQIEAIRQVHEAARQALDGDPEPWAQDARNVAEAMRTAPTPTITIRTLDEFLGRQS